MDLFFVCLFSLGKQHVHPVVGDRRRHRGRIRNANFGLLRPTRRLASRLLGVSIMACARLYRVNGVHIESTNSIVGPLLVYTAPVTVPLSAYKETRPGHDCRSLDVFGALDNTNHR